jgi:Na+-transporting NADH:ubiquinone oxidoreductase subunit NqrC
MSKISEMGSFGDDAGFFGQHDGDIVTHRIDALAGVTLQARGVGKQLNGSLADGTNKDGKKLFRNRHQPALRAPKKL